MLNALTFRNYLIIGAGGALGSMARFWLGDIGPVIMHSAFPWGILWANWLGCFVIGFFAEATGAKGLLNVTPEMRNFVIVGICGGFTTFSSFSLGALVLAHTSGAGLSLVYILASILGCLLAVTFGVWLVGVTRLSAQKGEDWEV